MLRHSHYVTAFSLGRCYNITMSHTRVHRAAPRYDPLTTRPLLPVHRARSQQAHIDTVLYYRQKHLAQLGGRAESIPKLAQAAQQLGPLNEANIRAKIDAEKVIVTTVMRDSNYCPDRRGEGNSRNSNDIQ